MQDELAETQIPDPGYGGTNLEIFQEHDDSDYLDYWEEREYVDDEYWDSAQLGALASKGTAKRKREVNFIESAGAKRRRMLIEGMDNVKYVTLAERLKVYYQAPPRLGNVKGFALLPDWQSRFEDATGVIVKKAMPDAMKKAAEAPDEESPLKKRTLDALAEDGDEEEWMDEDDAEEGDEEGEDMSAQLASLDPDAVNAILLQRLRDAGLDLDADAMKDTISKMLAGDDGADNAIGELASTLLGQATQGSDSALSGWLSQQGVSLEAVEDDDDVSSVATAELPSGVSKVANSNFQVSPPDSAIEISRQNNETKQLAIHGSSPSASAKKRAAPVDNEDGGTSKRKKVVFDVQPTSESTHLTADEYLDEGTRRSVPAPEVVPTVDPGTSEDPLMSEPTVRSTASEPKTSSEKTKASNGKAVTKNNSVSAKSAGAKNYAKTTAAASAKQTRKRKAEIEADEDEIIVTGPKQTRPARKAAKTEPETAKTEPPARRTRSARAKAVK